MKKKIIFGIGWFLAVTITTGLIVSEVRGEEFPLTGHLLTLIKKGYWGYFLVGIGSLLVSHKHNRAAGISCAAATLVTYISLLIYEIIVYGSDHNMLGIELAIVVALTLPWLLPGMIIDKVMKSRP